MKAIRILFSIAFCACILASCHDEQMPQKYANYLEIAHAAIGQDQATLQKALEKEGFTYSTAEALFVMNDTAHHRELTIEPSFEGGKLAAFILSGRFFGESSYENALKHYTDWDNYAYTVAFAPVGLWISAIQPEEDMKDMDYSELFEEGTFDDVKDYLGNVYCEGSLITTLRFMLMMSGNESAQILDSIITYTHNREDYKLYLESNVCFQEGDIYETFLSLKNLNLNQLMEGTLGSITSVSATFTGARETDVTGAPVYSFTFTYSGEEDIDLSSLGPIFGDM